MPMGVPVAHEVLRENEVSEAIRENCGRRISVFAMKSKTVGAGLALLKEGRGKQRRYKSAIRIQRDCTLPLVARNDGVKASS